MAQQQDDRSFTPHPTENVKWGAGHVNGMARAGLKELGQGLKAFPDSIGPIEEPGIAGNPTSFEVNQQKGNSAYQQFLEERAHQSAERKPPEQEMER